ncbi:MAG: NADAR family protein [Candidatus Eremiobacteraeota bacterium]|nr:NADAR family protein [Candidatus Eremiobacteraeota bacterium]
MIRDWDSLKAAVAGGLQPKYIFFWGHRPLKDGSIGKSCFSQWWLSAFEVDGVAYASAEHYMMAEKARLFGDEASRLAILAAATPAEAKKLGAQVGGFTESTWVQHRFEIVVRGNQARFTQNPDLADFLRKTGDRVLVEASPLDRIWGIGLAEDDPRCQDPEQWLGPNLLGFALMEVRSRL